MAKFSQKLLRVYFLWVEFNLIRNTFNFNLDNYLSPSAKADAKAILDSKLDPKTIAKILPFRSQQACQEINTAAGNSIVDSFWYEPLRNTTPYQDLLFALVSYPTRVFSKYMGYYLVPCKDETFIIMTEFPVACCRCLLCRVRCYSYYKGTHTLKVLIGVSPAGLITFLGEVYGGRASDKFLFNESGLLNKLEPGDTLMADKGFLIESECAERDIKLAQPPFMKDSRKFNSSQAEDTFSVARARVHVERSIQRMKTFKILSDKVLWIFVPYFEDILCNICGVINLSHPILADDKFR